MKNSLYRLRAAVMGLGVVIASMSGVAFAAGTDAGTTVSNTFTLDFSVGGVAQTQITNDGVGPNPAPTSFTVDRRVDLTVTAIDFTAGAGNLNVSAGSTGQELVFGVRNDGNDTQAYSLAIENIAGDDFDPTGVTARFYVDAGGDGIFTAGVDDAGAGTAYTLGSGSATTDVAEDATIWVIISGNIPAPQAAGNTADVALLADTLNPVTSVDPNYSLIPGAQATTSGSNTMTGEADTVLADGVGTATADTAGGGDQSATATYVIVAAALTASKVVAVIATDGAAIDCALDPALGGAQFAAPGACIEYTITAANAAGATADADSIDIGDTLPDDVAFVAATQSGFSTAGALTTPLLTCTTSCVVSLTGAALAPGATGTLTIRATVR